MTDTTVPAKATGDTVTADEFNDLVDAVNSKADDPVTLEVSSVTDLDEAAGGVAVGTGFQAVIDAGGAPSATLAGIIATLADSGGEQVPPAEESDHWENTPGLIIATPQSLGEAEAETDITPSSGSITVNGAQGWNFYTEITEASDVDVVSNLTMKPRKLRVLATGGAWDLDFTAADVLINIDTNVNILENKIASFDIWSNSDGDIFVKYEGQQDTAGGSGGLANVEEDTSPTLGGNLALGGFNVGDADAADLTKLSELTATSTELNYVDGVTSAIQTQLDGKQTANADLTSLVTNWVQASASGASSLDFHEDTDNGTNRVRLQGPASVADITVTLPAVAGTLLTGAAAEGATPTFASIEVGTSQTDTTITRASAGQIAVEGVNVIMNGGALGTPSSGTLSNCTAATTSAKGAVELATTAEMNTGTDTERVLGVDEFAASNFATAVIEIECFSPTVNVTTGNGAGYATIPACMNGMNLVRAQATVVTAGTTNATTVMVHNLTQAADMLSGAISIASAGVAGTVGTIDTGNDDVATDDRIRIDVDSVSSTAPKGLIVILEFRLP